MIFINNIDPVLLEFAGFTIRWYGVMFLIGLTLAYFINRWAFKKWEYSVDDLDSLVVYLFFGLVIGARLGHVLFYSFDYFWRHPVEILQIWNGGLASHGAAIGVLLAYLIWTYVHKIKFVKYADLIVLGMPVVAGFVRIGNFFNSEIFGTKTEGNFGVVFAKLGEDFPRHPSHLYEAILSFGIFFVMLWIFKKQGKKMPKLLLVSLYMLLYFAGRFVLEFWKDLHVLPESFPLSMGQVLSILPVFIAVFIGVYSRIRKN
jgi:prolipoprotein diacylglyceryl transferase